MKKIVILLLTIIPFVLMPASVFAETENNIGFSIQAVIPENQHDKEQSYFDLRMQPGQEQVIEVAIHNSSSEDSKFKVNVNQGYTNASGFIDYADADAPKDESLKFDISDIASYDSEVEVKANSQILLPITLNMPETEFDGQVLAGIQVVKINDQEGSGISNEYGYILGLKLTETDNPVKRELNLLSVEPAVSFAKTSVVARLQNPTMDAIGRLKYEAVVTNAKNGEIEREVFYDNDMQIAPNSTYDFAIDWDGQALKAGDYTLDLKVTDAKDNEWIFSENFNITRKEANTINAVTIDQGTNPSNLIWILVACAVVILLLLFIIVRQKQSKRAY